jgi:hypothetical protein
VFGDAFAALVDEKSKTAARELRGELEKVIAAGKAAGEVRPGSAELWADVWLRLVLLGLDRIARGTWKADEPAVQQVFDAAWDAVRGERTEAAGDRKEGRRLDG